MKIKFLNLLLVGSIVSSVMLSGCEKDEVVTPDPPGSSQEKGEFKDSRDGTTYKWIKIGEQVWMAENLSYTGTDIKHITDDIEWTGSTNDNGWCYYENFTSNGNIHGVLYQWEAAKTACPDGWHLPTRPEWIELMNYLEANSYSYDGIKGNDGIAKSLATNSGWSASGVPGAVGNSDFTEYQNKSGFSALPSGLRGNSGSFYGLGIRATWWSATKSGNLNAYITDLSNVKATVFYNATYGTTYGYSVRCVKDQNIQLFAAGVYSIAQQIDTETQRNIDLNFVKKTE